MKAFGLFLSLIVCAGCSTAPVESPLSRYGGQPMAVPVDFDRAANDVQVSSLAA